MGAWIRPDGKWKFIPDHFEYMRAHLTDFGFKKKDAGLFSLGNRTLLIEKATQRGWIRVRGTRPNLSMEFWRLDNNTIFNIKDFISTEKVDPDEKIMFEANSTGKSWYEPAAWILGEGALAVAANEGKKRRRS
jgi:hypothetical protein